jgi:cytochrome bd-type quinol oxidase subunit 2
MSQELFRYASVGLILGMGIAIVLAVYHAFRFFSKRSKAEERAWVGLLGPFAILFDHFWAPDALRHRTKFIAYFSVFLFLFASMLLLQHLFPELRPLRME